MELLLKSIIERFFLWSNHEGIKKTRQTIDYYKNCLIWTKNPPFRLYQKYSLKETIKMVIYLFIYLFQAF